MAKNYIDLARDHDDGTIKATVTGSATVTNSVRVAWDNSLEGDEVVGAINRAAEIVAANFDLVP